MNSLKNKKALVTGGVSGIGQTIVEELANLGASVAIHYYFEKPEEAEEVAAKVRAKGGDALIVGGDLTDENVVRGIMKTVKEKFGGLDVLVNNAGDLVARQPLEGMPLAFFRKVMAINMDTMMLVTREALPLMKNRPDGASIVNLASLAGRKGGAGGSLAYSTAKGAVLTWTRSLCQEVAGVGIRVNAVAPGFILGSRFHATHTTPEATRNIIAGIPLGRSGECDDIGRAVAFLASETNGFITGATLDVNGGVYMA